MDFDKGLALSSPLLKKGPPKKGPPRSFCSQLEVGDIDRAFVVEEEEGIAKAQAIMIVHKNPSFIVSAVQCVYEGHAYYYSKKRTSEVLFAQWATVEVLKSSDG